MKKVFISIFLALVMLVSIGGAVLADEANVDVSDITIVGTGQVGTQVTASGTITITALADSYVGGRFNPMDFATAFASWGFAITGVGTNLSGGDSNYDADMGRNGAEADASYATFDWVESFWIEDASTYDISLFGNALTLSFAGLFNGLEIKSDSITKTAKVTGYHLPDWYNNGKFEVVVGDFVYHGAYNWLPSTGELLEDVNLYGYSGGKGFIVRIPKGTIVKGTDRLFITYDPYGNYPIDGCVKIFAPQNATFSNPVGVYFQFSGGESLIESFTEIANGIISQSPERHGK